MKLHSKTLFDDLLVFKSSRPDVYRKKSALKNFADFLEKHNLLKSDSRTGEFCEIFRNSFCQGTPQLAASVCFYSRLRTGICLQRFTFCILFKHVTYNLKI